MPPKIRPCRTCGEPCAKGRQFCGWHVLDRLPIADQVAAADRRLAATPPDQRPPRVDKKFWPSMHRFCSGCCSYVPLWYARGSRCRACASRAQHGAAIEKTYGMSTEEYARLLRLQGGRCAICRAVPRTKRMAVDHDHETGANRGLLCKRCNHDLLGAAHDRVEILRAAIAYLEHPPLSGEWTAPHTTKPAPLIEEEDGPPPF